MKVRMQALQRFPYAGAYRDKGIQFDARGESDARLLEAIGRARRVADLPVASSSPAPAGAEVKIETKAVAFGGHEDTGEDLPGFVVAGR